MKTSIASIVILLFSSSSLFSQNLGFIGKKNMVEIFGTGSFPILKFLGHEPNYVKKNGSLEEKKDYLETAIYLNVARSFSKRLSIGLEYGRQKIDISAPYYFNRLNEVLYGEHEELLFSSNQILPKIEITGRNGIFGMGINHQVGIGFGSANFIEKDYLFDLDNNNLIGQEENFRKSFFDYSTVKSIKWRILMYSFNFRKPISKFLMLSYGFRYTINLPNRDVIYSDSKNYWLSKNELNDLFYRENWSNFIQFKVGLAFFI